MNALEKALPHVVTGLIAKRAELAGKVEHLQAQVRQATVELDHIEASIRIFQPDIDMETLGTRPVPAIHHAFKGETTRIVLETIRTAGRPVGTTTITEAVMKARGLDRNDAAMFRLMSKRVGACLRHWERGHGAIRSIAGPGQVKFWQLA
ncbi:MAG: hypothetical protein J0H61_14550 [Alphaproteobacteria bacterium]|nr:hypothetical protein [Alphaproteobacteria bacterium]